MYILYVSSDICHNNIIYLVFSYLKAIPIFVHIIGFDICQKYILYYACFKHPTILTEKSCLFMIWYLYNLYGIFSHSMSFYIVWNDDLAYMEYPHNHVVKYAHKYGKEYVRSQIFFSIFAELLHWICPQLWSLHNVDAHICVNICLINHEHMCFFTNIFTCCSFSCFMLILLLLLLLCANPTALASVSW